MMKLFHFKPTDNLNEVIFENRHKNYGAYSLRVEESKILQKAMFFGIATFITIAAMPLIVNAFKAKPIEDPITVFTLPPIIDVTEPDKKPEVVKTDKTPKTEAKVVNTQVPTPTKNTTKEKTLAKTSERKDAVSGFENKDGEDLSKLISTPIVKVPNEPEVTVKKPPVVIDEDNDVKIYADEEAKFPGGLNVFRTQVSKYFDQVDFQGSGDLLKATVTFVVEKDGSITNIKATGSDASFNKEAIKTISQIKGKWIPAKVKGKNVRYAFKIPISMQFD